MEEELEEKNLDYFVENNKNFYKPKKEGVNLFIIEILNKNTGSRNVLLTNNENLP